MSGVPAASRTPSTCATALGTSAGSANEARFTSHTPSRYAAITSGREAITARLRAMARMLAERGFVTKGVDSRVSGNNRLISTNSRWRPTNDVNGSGKFVIGPPPVSS